MKFNGGLIQCVVLNLMHCVVRDARADDGGMVSK